MVKLNDKIYKDFPELLSDNNLISYGNAIKECQCNYKRLEKAIKDFNIPIHNAIRLPSEQVCHYLACSDVEKIKPILIKEAKNEPIPEGYISKKEFCDMLGITKQNIVSMSYWCPELKKYTINIYVKNVLSRYYSTSTESLMFFKQKVNEYFKGRNKKQKEKIKQLNDSIDKELRISIEKIGNNFKHHKINIDTSALSKIMNTDSIYFKRLRAIYNKYSIQWVGDPKQYMLHHIVPVCYAKDYDYPQLNDLENLIYLPPNIHLLVHFLMYKCCYNNYKQKMISSIFIQLCNFQPEKLDESFINEIIKNMIKAFIPFPL